MSTQARINISIAALTTLAFALVGCGRQAFLVATNSNQFKAAGTFTIPAKVDILLAEDDTGSMYSVFPQVSQQMPQFLSTLSQKGWDYHFATIPLSAGGSLNQVVASTYDSNWGALWVPPYPGAQPNAPGTVSPSVFTTPSNYSGFMTSASISNSSGGLEPGFINIYNALTTGAQGTNFLRPDALLVMIVIGNGNDTSGVTYCNRGDGVVVPAEMTTASTASGCTMNGQSVPYQQTYASSLSSYASQFQGLKFLPNMAQFFAVVANENINCIVPSSGTNAYIGDRYQRMASTLGGLSYDICTQSISDVLTSLSNSLQATRLAYETVYLFMSQQPDPTTIQVIKYPNGDTSQAITLPQDPTNGWTYEGNVTNVYAIDFPIQLNLSSGYAVKLHGTARLEGNDTATINYKPAGVSNSVSK